MPTVSSSCVTVLLLLALFLIPVNSQGNDEITTDIALAHCGCSICTEQVWQTIADGFRYMRQCRRNECEASILMSSISLYYHFGVSLLVFICCSKSPFTAVDSEYFRYKIRMDHV